MNDLSLRLLRAFTTLATEGQFRKAAEKFNVSQSAFSQMISRLEEQLDVRLIDRDSRNMSLTPEGELLLPLAEQLQGNADALFRKLRDHSAHRQGKVAVSALPALTMDWMPSVMAKFRDASPGTQVQLFDVSELDKSWQMLRDRQVDFVLHPTLGHSDEFESIPLFEERFFLVCQPDHPLTQRKRLWLKDLAGQPYIQLEPAGSLGKILNPLLAAVPIADTGLAMQHHNSIAGLIANGFGISVAPGFSTLHYRLCGLSTVPLQDIQLRRRFVVLKRRGETPLPVVTLLLKLIAQNPPSHALPFRGARLAASGRPQAPRKGKPRRKDQARKLSR